MLTLGKHRPARLDYQPGTFRVVAQGTHVICAVSGAEIALADLRYWSHELQEAYATAEIAVARYAEAREQGLL
ncbi:DUF2093 domain-containing protein [Pacificimonas sp. ICDLI1SI03]|jgi:hypothetical protein|tara:strand:- start:25095 stop:25313 length:219 start_codon:yes stop_codon:yes gene_type:complete